MAPRKEIEHGTYKSYTLGFIVCTLLTFASFFVKEQNLFSGTSLFIALLFLGMIQVVIQLILFLHVGDEKPPRYNLIVFLFMVLVLVIVIFGSLWIMQNLNRYVMGY